MLQLNGQFPLVSAIMPVYNCRAFVKKAVESVLAQTFGDFELLIMDDASTDGTLDELAGLEDPRIFIHRSEKNLGQANQLNLGIQKSKGKYIAIVHGDDINDSQRFELQLKAFEKEAVDVIGTWIIYDGDWAGNWKTPVTAAECFAGMLCECPIAHPTVMIKKESLLRAGELYIQDMVPAEDYDLWVRMSATCRFSNIPRPLLKYRVHNSQVSQRNAGILKQKLNKIRSKFIELHLNNLEERNLSVLYSLWNFDPASVISRRMINDISRLPQLLDGKGGTDKKTWRNFFEQWVFEKMIITKNYEFGVGFYFLWRWPSALFKNKKTDILRILARSLHA
jgi:glycosyltransferase involved in cell wall biosynthesis